MFSRVPNYSSDLPAYFKLLHLKRRSSLDIRVDQRNRLVPLIYVSNYSISNVGVLWIYSRVLNYSTLNESPLRIIPTLQEQEIWIQSLCLLQFHSKRISISKSNDSYSTRRGDLDSNHYDCQNFSSVLIPVTDLLA